MNRRLGFDWGCGTCRSRAVVATCNVRDVGPANNDSADGSTINVMDLANMVFGASTEAAAKLIVLLGKGQRLQVQLLAEFRGGGAFGVISDKGCRDQWE